MHILFICHEYPPSNHGGVGTFTQTLARALVRAGHKASVIGTYADGAFGVTSDHGVKVTRLRSRGPRGARAFVDAIGLWRAVRHIMQIEPIDVIDGPEIAFWAAPSSLREHCSIRMNGGHHYFREAAHLRVDPVRSRLERRSFSRAGHISAVSQYVAERTRDLLDLGSQPIQILPNLVDISRFSPDPNAVMDPGRILFVGTVTEKKGIRQLVQALPLVRAEAPRAHLVVAGRDSISADGGSYVAYLRSIMDPPTAGHVAFLGQVSNDDVPDLLASAEVCAYPSHMEALPLAWIEAMAAGKALVASSTGPGPEVIEDGVSGLLRDPFDVPALARAIVAVLESGQLRRGLEAGARERATTTFSTERLLQINLDWFERIRPMQGAGSTN